MNDKQLKKLEKNGQKLQRLLQNILNRLPLVTGTISEFKEFCGNITMTNSRRLIVSANSDKGGIDVLLNINGPEGLTKIAQQIDFQLKDKGIQSDFEEAIGLLKETISVNAKSHSDLKRKLSSSRSEKPKLDLLKVNEEQFFTNSTLLGESLEQIISIHTVDYDEKNGQIKSLCIESHNDIVLASGARPYAQHFYRNIESAPLSEPSFISKSECNTDFINSKQSSEFIIQDYSHANIDRFFSGVNNFDNAFLFSFNSEALRKFSYVCGRNDNDYAKVSSGNFNICSFGTSCHSPTKKLAIIVLLPKSLARNSLPNVGCYPASFGQNNKNLAKQDFVFEKIPSSLTVHTFQPGNFNYSQHLSFEGSNEIIDSAIGFSGKDASDYTGFLLSVNFPLWLASYQIYFEING